MNDTTVKKVSSTHSPTGDAGQKYLASGQNLSMRLWEQERPSEPKPNTQADYETVGFVVSGRAELETEGQTVILEPGDSWVVPKGAVHHYTILETFTAVEAIHPPSQVADHEQV